MEPVSKLHLDDVKWYHDPTAGDSIPTCCLHSYTLSVLTALNAQEDQVDPVWVAGASGMAFRIWAHQDLCPSATSVFDWSLLPRGVENAGWSVDYHSRLWHEESVAEERRKAAHAAIVKALNAGRVPVCWDIGVPEWGVITGYDDEAQDTPRLPYTADLLRSSTTSSAEETSRSCRLRSSRAATASTGVRLS